MANETKYKCPICDGAMNDAIFSIIEEFARRGTVTDSRGACVWCGAIRAGTSGESLEHKGSCILRRSRELAKTRVGAINCSQYKEKSMTVRAKFQLQEVTNNHWSKDSKVLTFRASYDTSIPEDQRFQKATPSGEFKMHVDNPSAVAAFELGRYYYLDASPVPCSEPGCEGVAGHERDEPHGTRG